MVRFVVIFIIKAKTKEYFINESWYFLLLVEQKCPVDTTCQATNVGAHLAK